MKLAAAVLSGASIVALSLAVASPANAAGNAIDPGDALFAINCDEIYNDFQLFSVDSTTAFSTPIGDGAGSWSSTCAFQPAYNPATGKSYYIQKSAGYDVLAEIDVVTGVSTPIDGFYWDNKEFPEFIDVISMAIGADGAAYVISAGSVLFSVDLDNGLVTPIGQTVNAFAFAADPVTGKFYGIDTYNEISEIDVETGLPTLVGEIGFPETEGTHRTYSLQFDGAGTFWVEVDYVEVEQLFQAELWSFTADTLDSPVFSGVFTDDPFYTEAILIIPGEFAVIPVEPALAATGADLADVLPWAIGAAVIVLAGGVLLILRSRRKPVAITTTEQASVPEIESKD